MRGILMAIAILATTALPSFAAGEPPRGCAETMAMMQHRDPQHLLMRAYHENVALFARTLAAIAGQRETVPRETARTALAEMRRSTEEMEKLRASALGKGDSGGSDRMQKMLDEHLVAAKTELRQLEELSKRDVIPSREVLQHLQVLSRGCGEVAGAAMPCHKEQMDCGGCRCGKMMHGCGDMKGGCGEMMQRGGRPQLMQNMVERMKGEDAELERQVAKLQQAPREQKVDLLADIVTRLVRQRAEMTSHMEKMQQHFRHGHPGGCKAGGATLAAPPGGAEPSGAGPDEGDDEGGEGE